MGCYVPPAPIKIIIRLPPPGSKFVALYRSMMMVPTRPSRWRMPFGVGICLYVSRLSKAFSLSVYRFYPCDRINWGAKSLPENKPPAMFFCSFSVFKLLVLLYCNHVIRFGLMRIDTARPNVLAPQRYPSHPETSRVWWRSTMPSDKYVIIQFDGGVMQAPRHMIAQIRTRTVTHELCLCLWCV